MLGATGNLGSVLVNQALDVGHEVKDVVRNPERLVPQTTKRVDVHRGDLGSMPDSELAGLIGGSEVASGDFYTPPAVVLASTTSALASSLVL